MLDEIIPVLWYTCNPATSHLPEHILSVGLLGNSRVCHGKWGGNQQREEESQGSRIQREDTSRILGMWKEALTRMYEVDLAYVAY